MAPQPPLLLYDNVFDTVQLYPAGVVTATSQRTGHEGYRVASYRRERQSWQTQTIAAAHYVTVDLGVGVTRACDSLFIDRGHNLWGASVQLMWSDDGAAFTAIAALAVPAVGTLGGVPTAGLSVTEEGALWTLFTATAAHRWWRFRVNTSMAPVVTGLIAGMRAQLDYSTIFDEDAGERTDVSVTSIAGYRGADTTYSWRTLELGLTYLDGATYDAKIRLLRDTLFKRNQPFFGCLDYGTRPERGWLYQYEGKTWAMPKRRVYRAGTIRARELGASLS